MNKHATLFLFGTFFLGASLFLSPLALADSSYYWTGGGGDGQFGNPANWAGGQAPTGSSSDLERLYFRNVAGTVTNNLVGATYGELFFSDGDYNYFGNNANVAQLTLSVTGSNSSSVWVGPNVAGSDIFFDYDDFRPVQENPAWLQFGIGGTIHLTGADSNRFSTYGYSTFSNRVLLAASGNMVADSPAEAWIGTATLALNGGDQAGIAGRIGSNIHVFLDHGGRLLLNGYAGESSAFTETVSQLTVVGSGIIGVNHSGGPNTNLNVGLDVATGGLALFNATGSTLGASARIFLDGQSDSAFLGPQYFALDGDVNYGGGYAKYNFAGYSTTSGVVSATNLDNPADLSVAGASSIVQIDQANAAALLDDPDPENRNYKLTGDATVRALAFNADYLYGESSPGSAYTINLEHLLISHDTAAIAVNLNFGATAGTITTENWFLNHYPEVDVYGAIAGTNSLTIRGFGELNVRAAATFSGTLNVLGGFLNLDDSASFAGVETIYLGAPVIASSIDLFGVDPNGVAVNRLNDNVQIFAQGESWLDLESDAAGVTPLTEKIGSIVVDGNESHFQLIVEAGDLDTHTSASAATWDVSSLGFTSSATNSRISLQAYGAGNTITIGGPIVIAHGNLLDIVQESGGRIITGGIQMAAGSDGIVVLNGVDAGTIEGDLDLQGGYFQINTTASTLLGNLTMGEALQTYIYLPVLDTESSFAAMSFSALDAALPLLSIDGNLLLDGTLNISQQGAFTEGSWRLFQYTGLFENLGITVNGLDGAYTLTIDTDSQSVYINAVPEPGTCLLVTLGLGVLARRRSRRH